MGTRRRMGLVRQNRCVGEQKVMGRRPTVRGFENVAECEGQDLVLEVHGVTLRG